MKSIAVLFVLVAVALAMRTPSIVFNRTNGLNLTDAARLFPVRNSTLQTVFIRKAYNGIYGSCESESGSYSTIGGGVLIGDASNEDVSFYIPPSIIGFHYTSARSIDMKELARIIYYKRPADDPIFNTLIALTFPGVVELDMQNRAVTVVSFNTSGKPANETWSPFTPVGQGKEGIKAYSSTLKTAKGIQFRFTIVASDVAGVMEYGYTPLSPTSVNYIVEIENWPYKSEYYRLGLIIGTGIKINEGHFKDNFTSREDQDGNLLSYVGLPGYAVVDNQIISINTINNAADIIRRTSLVYNPDAVNLMGLLLFDGKPYTQFRCVVFPHTAQNIIYGTAVGAGAPIYSHVKVPAGTYSAASSLILSFVAVLLALVLVF